MEIEDLFIGVIGLLVVFALLLGVPYGAYKYGRHVERRLLTAAFMQTMSQDYAVGEEAGIKEGYQKGYRDGVGAGKMEILKEQDDARY